MIVFLPFRAYSSRLGKMRQQVKQVLEPDAVKLAGHITNIVEAVCNRTPWQSTCLVQAIVCKQLLQKHGIHCTLYLGLLRMDGSRKLTSHAWLKAGEVLLTGARGYERFKVVNYYG